MLRKEPSVNTHTTEWKKHLLSAAVTILRPLHPGISLGDLDEFLDQKFGGQQPDKLFTRKDVSKKTKLSISTIDRLIKARQIDVIHIRRSIRIPASSVASLLETQPEEQAEPSDPTTNAATNN
jgi:predicted DNA-binding transcriptional regulator AlpA